MNLKINSFSLFVKNQKRLILQSQFKHFSQNNKTSTQTITKKQTKSIFKNVENPQTAVEKNSSSVKELPKTFY